MSKENPRHFIGRKLLAWYGVFGRDLPFRRTKIPYNIWVCEIIFQQTRIAQGLAHYENFIEKFPDVHVLAAASEDEVLLAWKGLGYYSRALNLRTAARQIISDFNGKFPVNYDDILKLKGVGKYTAAAISSICFNERRPAVDGNFYRVLSRFFADDFDISSSAAHQYFYDLALRIMPPEAPGKFNEAVMDLGSEICTPKNPDCHACPLTDDCTAFSTGKVSLFPNKVKKVKTADMRLEYFFVKFSGHFLVKRRNAESIWKNLYEFPKNIPAEWQQFITKKTSVQHKLTHRNLLIDISTVELPDFLSFKKFAKINGYLIETFESSAGKSFPKPLQSFIEKTVGKAVSADS